MNIHEFPLDIALIVCLMLAGIALIIAITGSMD